MGAQNQTEEMVTTKGTNLSKKPPVKIVPLEKKSINVVQ